MHVNMNENLEILRLCLDDEVKPSVLWQTAKRNPHTLSKISDMVMVVAATTHRNANEKMEKLCEFCGNVWSDQMKHLLVSCSKMEAARNVHMTKARKIPGNELVDMLLSGDEDLVYAALLGGNSDCDAYIILCADLVSQVITHIDKDDVMFLVQRRQASTNKRSSL